MWKLIQILAIAVLVNGSYYSFNFAFWASGPNTKMILSLFGVLWFLYDSWRGGKGISIPRVLLGGAIFSILYSLVNLIAVEINNTDDYSYANYITTFLVWVFSVYPAIRCIRIVHGEVTVSRITYYLVGVTVFQCITGLLNDNFPAAQNFTDSIVFWAGDFYESIDRMRCFSAALDPAGVRFSLVLILISAVVCTDTEVQKSRWIVFLLLISYILISVIGNMVARTTSTGMAMGLILLLFRSNAIGFRIRKEMVQTMATFSLLLVFFSVAGVLLYNTSEYFRGQLMFAFEGFFNYFNKGEFTTGSTEVLQTMWRWPEDDKTWIIGSGRYGGFIYSTDIGYCRLILYSGLIGFVTFASSFVYYAYYFARKYPRYFWLFLFYLAMTFIVWLKVSTDILMIYVFFFWFTAEESDHMNGIFPEATAEPCE